MNERRGFLAGLVGGTLGLLGLKETAKSPMSTPEFTKLEPCIFKGQPTIRLWKLGSLEHKIVPTEEAINTLRRNLIDMRNNIEKGIDSEMVWGPDLEVVTIQGDINDVDIIEKEDGSRVFLIKNYDGPTQSGGGQEGTETKRPKVN